MLELDRFRIVEHGRSTGDRPVPDAELLLSVMKNISVGSAQQRYDFLAPPKKPRSASAVAGFLRIYFEDRSLFSAYTGFKVAEDTSIRDVRGMIAEKYKMEDRGAGYVLLLKNETTGARTVMSDDESALEVANTLAASNGAPSGKKPGLFSLFYVSIESLPSSPLRVYLQVCPR